MASLALSIRDRFELISRALVGTMPTNRESVGGRIVSGVISSGGYPPVRGTKEILATYGRRPWVRAVVGRISFDVASTEWCLYAKRGSDGRAVRDAQVKFLQRAPVKDREKALAKAIEDGDVEKVDNHQLLDLLGSFNSFHTGLAARRVTQQHLDLVGEAFWIIERDNRGMPVALWPIPPSWVLGTPTVARPFFRMSFNGWQVVIPATEVVWFSELDPANPYARGSGTAQSLADDVETDEYAAKHVKAFFYNRARPDLVVSPKDGDSDMNEPEVRRLEQEWASKTQGFWRAFKPFFMRRAVDVKVIDQDFKSQQYIQIREFERNTCIQVFGVSPEILGIVSSGSSRATVTVAEYIYARRVIVPRLEMQRATMQERLVPEFDERLILAYESPVQADAELEQQAVASTPYVLTIDEHRARINREPLPNGAGKVRMVPPTLDPVNDEGDDDLPLRQPEADGEVGDPNEARWDGRLR